MEKRLSRRDLLQFTVGSMAMGAIAGAKAGLENTAPKLLDDELLEYDAVGLAELIRDRHVSSREVLQASISRIERLDGTLNAVTTRSFSRAIDRLDQIGPDTPFAGVPTLLKDLVDVGGIRRTSGSRLLLSNIPEESVEYVQAMERAGLNFLGMTNTPEFASGALTDNLAFGATRNPWDLERSAGGSSGGSGAAIAAGYVPLAHGTDGGGSNRIPASCCGVLGMKPSRYRQVSGEKGGKHMFLRTHQSLSRSVRDSATLLAATENPDNRAGYPLVGKVDAPSRRRLRIAFSLENCLGVLPEKTVAAAVEQTAHLCASLGHHVSEVKNPINGASMFKAFEGISLVGMPGLLATVESLTGRKAEEAGILSQAMVDLGRYSESLDANSYDDGLAWFRRAESGFADFFQQFDLWLTATLPIETPKIGYVGPNTEFGLAHSRNQELMSYTAVANGFGAPAMSIPLFLSSETGLPIGSHFIAAPGADRTVYELAYELEAAKPWANLWGPFSAKHQS